MRNMNTNQRYAVYFVGGSFDLTKRMYKGDMPGGPYIPMAEVELKEGFNWADPADKTIKDHKKELYKIIDGPKVINRIVTYVAYFYTAE